MYQKIIAPINTQSLIKKGNRDFSLPQQQESALFGIGMSMSLCMAPKLTLNQKLTQQIKMKMSQTLTLSLKLYQKKENEAKKLWNLADKRNDIKEYNNHNMGFNYALIGKKDVSPKIIENYGYAFSHCLYNKFDAMLFGKKYAFSKGEWLLFVVKDLFNNFPRAYEHYAAIHERGEQLTAGNHFDATKLEFAIAKKEEMLTKYITWLNKNAPRKLGQVIEFEQFHQPLPKENNFIDIAKQQSTGEEAQTVKEMIEDFEWPTTVLIEIKKHKTKRKKIYKIIDNTLEMAKQKITGLLSKKQGQEYKKEIENIFKNMCNDIITVGKNYIDCPRINAILNPLLINIENEFLKTLSYHQQGMDSSQQIDLLNYLQNTIGFNNSLSDFGFWDKKIENIFKYFKIKL